ncbi:3'-5' exonuclease Snipper-like [Calliphora vicina]|uniref:3'-5' exonuclease Snipper-like n=1 Tax=Calliphora vicina TaxID=7373 RepID=UPI00325C2E73
MFSHQTNSANSQHPYKYIIAVDFEATCFRDQPRLAELRKSEIIEFPAVLFNLKTGQIEAQFHQYVKPIERPILSEYCIELTGITQQSVDNGIPLQNAFKLFEDWLRKELRSRNLMLPKESKENKQGNCAFVTWSDCDFGIFLHNECRRKGLVKPKYFNQWIDMREICMNKYGNKTSKFSYALSYVGVQFVGKKHSGIDDAKNLAALTQKLVNNGVTLKITTDLTPTEWNLNCF